MYKEYIASAEVENIMTGRLLVFPGLIKLRKICNHPDLTTGELRTKYTPGKTTDKEEGYGYYKRSGKLVVCKVGVLSFRFVAQLFSVAQTHFQNSWIPFLDKDYSWLCVVLSSVDMLALWNAQPKYGI